jgi:hypothetical protein
MPPVPSCSGARWARSSFRRSCSPRRRISSGKRSIVATAERLGEANVATLDRRHFTVVRPAHVEAFTLLP